MLQRPLRRNMRFCEGEAASTSINWQPIIARCGRASSSLDGRLFCPVARLDEMVRFNEAIDQALAEGAGARPAFSRSMLISAASFRHSLYALESCVYRAVGDVYSWIRTCKTLAAMKRATLQNWS